MTEWTQAGSSDTLPHRMVRLPPIRALAAIVLLAVVVPACRGRDPEPTPRPTPRPTPTPVPRHEAPLTGEVTEGETPDWQSRRALAVKIGNSGPERPQSGLEHADVVYEELAEGGITRFISVFHSSKPGTVGPVRSARFVDPDLLAPLSPVFAYAGGVPPVVAAVGAQESILDLNIDRFEDAYERSSDRRAPYNLYVSTDAIWRRAEGGPPPALFSWMPEGEGTDPNSGEPASRATLSFSPQTSVLYTYDPDAGAYLRSNGAEPHMLNDGSRVNPVNVLIQHVTVRAGSVVDRNNQVSPDSVVIGDGDAILLRGGRAFRGRWERSGTEPTRFIDAEGNPLLLARGQTYVELVPNGRAVRLS